VHGGEPAASMAHRGDRPHVCVHERRGYHHQAVVQALCWRDSVQQERSLPLHCAAWGGSLK